MNFVYFTLYHIPSGDALHQIDEMILVGSRTSSVKTTCRNLCPVNLLQLSNLIFDHCFNVQLGHYKSPFVFLIVAPCALNPTWISAKTQWEIKAVAVVLLHLFYSITDRVFLNLEFSKFWPPS